MTDPRGDNYQSGSKMDTGERDNSSKNQVTSQTQQAPMVPSFDQQHHPAYQNLSNNPGQAPAGRPQTYINQQHQHHPASQHLSNNPGQGPAGRPQMYPNEQHGYQGRPFAMSQQQQHHPVSQLSLNNPGQARAGHPQMYPNTQHGYQGRPFAMSQQQALPLQYQQSASSPGEAWSCIQSNLRLNNMVMKFIPGDGHCLINATRRSLQAQNLRDLTYEELCSLLVKEFEGNREYYSNFGGNEKGFIEDLFKYVTEKRYDTKAVDVVLPAFCNVLTVTYKIFEYRNGSITERFHTPGRENVKSTAMICLAYDGKHYNAVYPHVPSSVNESKVEDGHGHAQHNDCKTTLPEEKGNMSPFNPEKDQPFQRAGQGKTLREKMTDLRVGEDDCQTDSVIDAPETEQLPQGQANPNAVPPQQAPIGPPGFPMQQSSPNWNPVPSGTQPGYQHQLPYVYQIPSGAYGQQHHPASQHWPNHPGQAPAGHPQVYPHEHGYQGPPYAMNQQHHPPPQYHNPVLYSPRDQQPGSVPNPQNMQFYHPGYQNQYPPGMQGQPLATVPIYQRDVQTRPPHFTGVPTSTEHFDAALVFAKGDEELADDIVEKMNNLELEDGYKPKVCLSDHDCFGPNSVVKAKPMIKLCTLIFVVLSKNMTEDRAAAVVREEAIGMTRLAPTKELDDGRRYCVRPLHTLSPELRKGIYSVPCGLTSIDSIDWFQFGSKFFNRRLIKTFEYYLPYRLKREREQTSSGNVNINTERIANPNVHYQWQGLGHQYPDTSINIHPSIPMSSANTSNDTPLIPAKTEVPSDSGKRIATRSTEPANQVAEVGVAGGVCEPRDNDSNVSQKQRIARNTATSGNVSSEITHQSNVSQTAATRSMVHAENDATLNQSMVSPRCDPQDIKRSSSMNQQPFPAAGPSEAAAGRSLVSDQTLGKKTPASSEASGRTPPTDESYENVAVSRLQARVGGDNEASHDTSSLQPTNTSRQVNPTLGNDREKTPFPSSLPTEVDKDSGAESLQLAHSGNGGSETDGGLPDSSQGSGSKMLPFFKSRTGQESGSPARSVPEAIPRSQIAKKGQEALSRSPPARSGPKAKSRSPPGRSPGDGQEKDDQTTLKPDVAIVKPTLFKKSSNEDAETVPKVKSSGPAYRSSKCGAGNDHLENTGPSRATSTTAAPHVVHHFIHFAGAGAPAGLTGGGQSADPNLVLPDQLLQGLGGSVLQNQVPHRRAETVRDRIGENNVHVEATAPINIVNCKNVQIGSGEINIGSAQSETPARASGNDDDDDNDDDEHDESFPIVDCPPSAPPPYSRHDPRGGPGRAHATQTMIRPDPGTQDSGLAGSSQTEVKRRLDEHMTPPNSSCSSQTAAKRRITESEVSEGSNTSQREFEQRVNNSLSPELNRGHPDHDSTGEEAQAQQNERRTNIPNPTNPEGPSTVNQTRGSSPQMQVTSTDQTTSDRECSERGNDVNTSRADESAGANNPADETSTQDHYSMTQDGPSTGTPFRGPSIDEQRGQGQGRGPSNPEGLPRSEGLHGPNTGPLPDEGEGVSGLPELEDPPSEQDDSGTSYFIDSLPGDGRDLVDDAIKLDSAHSNGDNPNHHSRSDLSTSSVNKEKTARMRSPNKRRQDVYLTAGKHCIKNSTQNQRESPSSHEEID